jgi:metal-responsive CopG/Arc/MetJ family transcriptional regulator
MVTKLSISLDYELAERLHDQLDYGDNRSEWIADAIEQKLDRLEEGEEGNAETLMTAD